MAADDSSTSSSSSDSNSSSEAEAEQAPAKEDQSPAPPAPEPPAVANDSGSDAGNELPQLPEDLEEEDPKALTKTQVMQARQARKAGTRSMTRSFTTGLMPLSARSSDPDHDHPDLEGPESPHLPSSRVKSDEDAGESQGKRCCRLPPCCPELRARWKRRAERCCWPCLRVAGALGRCWDAFESRCQALARSIRCLCCPVLLLFRILSCGLCRRPSPPVQRTTSLRRTFRKTQSKAAGAAVSRTTSFGVSRTISGGSRKSRMTRSSTWGNSRFAEGPPVQPRSQLKERKLRVGQQEQQKIQVAKPQSVREEFRQLRRQATQKAAEEANAAALEDFEEDLEVLTGWEALIWTDFLPWNWPQTYQVWKESRAEMWAALGPILRKMEAADDPDSPYPKCLRRRWRIFFFAYWDPLVDSLPTVGRVVTCVLWSLLLIPVSLFIASNFFLLMSVLRNFEYVAGDCVIESLPMSFSTERGVVTKVVGSYLIRRFYRPSSVRLEGFVLQSCDIRVPCDHVDLSRTGRVEDDRCDSFQIWAWNDPITCFYRRDDEYGVKFDSLLCLSKPSDLQEEIFGVILSSCALLLSLLLVAFVWLRRWLERREAHRQAKDFEEQMEKERQEADQIALQQFEEFMKQEDAEEDDDEDEGSVEGLVFAMEGTTSLHSRVTRVNGRMTMRGSVSEPVSNV